MLKLMWCLGPYHSTNPRRFLFLACVSVGVVIGAALGDLRAAGAVVADVLAAAVLAWLVPLLRQETAAWAMLIWRAAPKRIRSAALTVPIVVVPALCAAGLALSAPLDAVVLAVVFSAYFVVVLAALEAVPPARTGVTRSAARCLPEAEEPWQGLALREQHRQLTLARW
ncbi:hypothetical protein [Kutzneria sp. NPDC052558]|uniref:hypothetical protein n=1 Tax=Kutzneria sp. NPDC052558 TaxID=3364121 RepID=UPI0037C51D27